jgi:hypothetical protein
MTKLKGQFMDVDGARVDYDGMKGSPDYKVYCQLAQNLVYIDLNLLDESTTKAFFINLYNALCIHALVEGLLQGSFLGDSIARLRMYASASYNIGGNIYSLNDIEHGILRNNSQSPAPFSRKVQFDANDPRSKYSIPCDPRIHFALNCGAESCPPIAIYSMDEDKPEKLENQLNIATECFIENSANFHASNEVITLSMIFKWYKNDFTAAVSDDESTKSAFEKLLLWIKSHGGKDVEAQLSSSALGKFKVIHSKYNWGLNKRG